MLFSIFGLLAAAAISSALPTAPPNAFEKRQNRNTRITPTALTRVYEHAPNLISGQDGWGETSNSPGQALTGVNTLISFQLAREDGGRTCNLRFADPSFATGSKTFSVFEFVPSNGVTFDVTKATWNQRTGYRDRQLAIYTYEEGRDIVYSFTCPTGGKLLNYELTASNGEVNIRWNVPRGEGLWLEVVVPPATPLSAPPVPKPIVIPLKDQCPLYEATANTGKGSMQFGEVSNSARNQMVSTLVGWVMPAEDYTGRTCTLRFSNPTTATGSKSFAVFDFIPYGNEVIFKSWLATWNSKTGYRNLERTIYKVGDDKKPVYSFLCPGPGKGVNFDLVPTGGDVSIKWNTQGTPAGGPRLEVS
jgi:hypothetical protein